MLDKVSKIAKNVLNELVKEGKVLRVKDYTVINRTKMFDIEILGKSLELFFEVKNEKIIICHIANETNELELQKEIAEEEIAKGIKKFLEKRIQSQRIENAINLPKKYFEQLVGFNNQLQKDIWKDLIRDHTSEEIELDAFQTITKRQAQIHHVSDNHTFFMFRICGKYFTISYNKETRNCEIEKSMNREEALLSYTNLIMKEVEKDIEVI
jgi:hypothetical protein